MIYINDENMKKFFSIVLVLRTVYNIQNAWS
jgi:hypothetical protein